jgi:thiol-disulfide isomerase/thioredoxin
VIKALINQIFILALGLLLTLSLTGCDNKEPFYALIDGGEIKFSELQGRVVFINYWAEWCKPCRKEIPELNALHQQFSDHALVLGVNFDSAQNDQLINQAKAMGIEFPVLTTDPRLLFGVKASGVLPETLVIDRYGILHEVLLGPQTIEKLEAIVNKLTANKLSTLEY